jgi:hypothetical protein
MQKRWSAFSVILRPSVLTASSLNFITVMIFGAIKISHLTKEEALP